MKKTLLIFTFCICILLSGCGTSTENIHIDNRNILKDSNINIQIDKSTHSKIIKRNTWKMDVL